MEAYPMEDPKMDLFTLAQAANSDFSVVLYTLLWIVVGAAMLAAGHKVADWITPGKLWDEIAKGNLAISLTAAGVLIGEALVIAAVIGGTGSAHDDGIFQILGNARLNLMLNSVLWGLGSVAIMAVLYTVFDLCTPSVKFKEQLEKNNVALGTFLGGLFVAWGFIISGVLGS